VRVPRRLMLFCAFGRSALRTNATISLANALRLAAFYVEIREGIRPPRLAGRAGGRNRRITPSAKTLDADIAKVVDSGTCTTWPSMRGRVPRE
jgi:hypothetical protein